MRVLSDIGSGTEMEKFGLFGRVKALSLDTNALLAVLLLAARFCLCESLHIICLLLWEGELQFSVSDFGSFTQIKMQWSSEIQLL